MLTIAQLVVQRSNRQVAREQLRGEIRRLKEQLDFCYSELKEFEKVDGMAFNTLLDYAEQGQANLGPPPE
jgi:hypothetical protein